MIDFKAIIEETDKYNFHSHTQFCDGRASMAEFTKAAVDAGFRHYGFSPHSPVTVSSPCNMSFESVSDYIAEFQRLKAEFADRIKLYLSMEIDYLGDEWGPSNPYFDSISLDYRIGSVHFIPNQMGEAVDIDGSRESFKRKMLEKFNGDIRYVVNTFYDHSLEMVRRGGFDIIGHFDKIGHNASYFRPGIEDESWYQERVDELISEIISADLVVEINTKAWCDYGRFFPSQRYWKRLIENNVTIVANSDAHYPELIDASRREAIGLLNKIKSSGFHADVKSYGY